MADRVVMTNPALGGATKVTSRRAFERVHQANGWQIVEGADPRDVQFDSGSLTVPLEAHSPAGLRMLARKRNIDVSDIEAGDGEKPALIERLRPTIVEPAPAAPTRRTAAADAAPDAPAAPVETTEQEQ